MIGNSVLVTALITPAQLSFAFGTGKVSILHSAMISSSSAETGTGAVVSSTVIV